jgi:hypothetical protein
MPPAKKKGVKGKKGAKKEDVPEPVPEVEAKSEPVQ